MDKTKKVYARNNEWQDENKDLNIEKTSIDHLTIDYINVETNSLEGEQEPSEELGKIFEEDGERSSEREEEINNDLLLIDPLGDMWDIGNDIDFLYSYK